MCETDYLLLSLFYSLMGQWSLYSACASCQHFQSLAQFHLYRTSEQNGSQSISSWEALCSPQRVASVGCGPLHDLVRGSCNQGQYSLKTINR